MQVPRGTCSSLPFPLPHVGTGELPSAAKGYIMGSHGSY